MLSYLSFILYSYTLQGCISYGTCSYLELTEDHVLTSAYVKIFRIVTRNAVNKSFWRKKDCSWPPLNKYAMNIWLSSLKIRAHLSWRTGKHLHVLHVLRTYSTCSCPGQQDTTTYSALRTGKQNSVYFWPITHLWLPIYIDARGNNWDKNQKQNVLWNFSLKEKNIC